MPNQDFPDVCLASMDKNCKLVTPDISAFRERIRDNPLTDYTLNVVNNLTFAMPDKFTNNEDAYMAFDAVKAVIAMGLKNKDNVTFHGLGKFEVQGTGADAKVVFTPDPALNAAVAE
jgi:stringent starvation protein B